MPLPKPQADEKEGDFISRCIGAIFDEGTLQGRSLNADDEDDRKQVTAVCYSQWGGDGQQEAAIMPFTDIRQIAASAIEVGLAFLTGDTKVKQADGLRLLEALQGDLEALKEATKTVGGESYPASDFLVVEDSDMPSTWHLQVKRNGTPDHNLMGAAWAALHGGYRGNKYAGPNKSEAISKLTALYKAEDMETPATESAPLTIDIAVNLLAELDEMREKLARFVRDIDGGDIEADGQAVEVARDATEADLSELDAAIETGRRAPVVVDFRILQPGPGNKRQNHYYPADVVKRDIHVFEGADVFATDHREAERSERTKVGIVLDCPTRFTESDAPVAQVLIYDPGQAEKTRNRADAGKLETMECSIFGIGRAADGEVDGKKYKIVEAITEGKFLELVSKAGAGGRAIGLAENTTGGVEMADENEAKPTPVEEVEIEESEAEVEQPKALDGDVVEKALAETNLPRFAVAYLKARQYATEDELKAAISEATAEVKKISGSGQVTGLGESEQPQEKTLTLEEREQRSLDAFNAVMREVGRQEV